MIGIYKITNKINGKFYIGSSVNIHKRWISHKCDLNKNRHPNNHLQRSFNKHGFDIFDFTVLEHCTKENIKEREQYYLDTLFNKNCYNIFKESYAVNGENHPMYGISHSKEAKYKIKQARAKQIIKHSQETKDKIGKAHKGRKMKPGHMEVLLKSREGLTVWNKGKKTGIEPPNKLKIDPLPIIKLYTNGESMESIRKKLGISWNVVKRILTDNNIKTRNISEQKTIYDRKNK